MPKSLYIDPEVVRQFAEDASKEYRALGITTALGPQIDICTEPRWMRFIDTLGEEVEKTKEMVDYAVRNLTLHRETVNQLNVFPVPDGDTGINMSATINAAVESSVSTVPSRRDTRMAPSRAQKYTCVCAGVTDHSSSPATSVSCRMQDVKSCVSPFLIWRRQKLWQSCLESDGRPSCPRWSKKHGSQR